MPSTPKKPSKLQRAYRRGNKSHYAALGRKSVEARIKRHISVEVMRDQKRVTTFPARKRESDAGYDITTPHALVLPAGQSALISTGLRVRCPKGYFYEVRGRSSLNRLGIVTMDNIVDATYTGELIVRMTNTGTETLRVEPGDRIAQLLFLPQIHVTFHPVEKFTEEPGDRGAEGWGSSGKKAFEPDIPV